MYTIAFIGKSGTGKSHRSIGIASKFKADAIIDDGLLISKNKVLAGFSAKKETTKMAAVKRALFTDENHVNSVKNAIENNNIKRILILGTSLRMVNLIATQLGIGKIDEIINIEDVATPEEIEEARQMRDGEGKHVIPVPIVEIKQDFSGYFLHPLRQIRKNLGRTITSSADKSIVRPTFSYLGDYTISDSVINNLVEFEALKINGIAKVNNIYAANTDGGVEIFLSVWVKYGCNITETASDVQNIVKKSIYYHTSINVKKVEIAVKKIIFQ